MGKIVGNVLSFGLVMGLLAGCTTTGNNLPDTPPPTSNTPTSTPRDPADATPTKTPPSRTGNPKSYIVFGKRYHVMPSSEGFRQQGIASWYGPKFHGKKTSSGVPFDMYAMTAAHKNLPIPTYVRVTHLGNGRSIVVKVNDRGPFSKQRVIDLSYAAARKLDMLKAGTAAVEVVALPPYQYLADARPTPSPPLVLQTTRSNRSPGEGTAPTVETSGQQRTAVTTATDVESVYMQVGAFSQRHNAEQLQSQLAGRLDHPVQINSSTGDLHKVLIGPLSHYSEADGLTLKLASLGVGNPHLVYE